LQAFRNSKGHQKLLDKHLKYTVDDDEREEQDDPQAMRQTAPKAIEKSFTDGLEFEYFVGSWSACSQSCGVNDSGYKVSFLDDFLIRGGTVKFKKLNF
jgi:hypothetical protein